jgi:hypothetical protein
LAANWADKAVFGFWANEALATHAKVKIHRKRNIESYFREFETVI